MEKVNGDDSLEFKWLKKRGVGKKSKEIQFYESFIFDGVEYMLHDCVYMYKGDSEHAYIGKLTKIWEGLDKSKKVKIHWFFLPEEICSWLGETKTVENEVFFASGGGDGLANINPLEAIAGPCNVVCVSEDSRNPQPSDEELKAADFIFSRTFNVDNCTISDKMDDNFGGLEIEYVFNRKKGEKSNPSAGPSDANTIISSETVTKTVPKDAKGDPQDNDVPKSLKRNAESDKSHDRPSKKTKSEDKGGESGGAKGTEKLTELPSTKFKVDKDKMQVNIVPAEKERNKTPIGSDKSHDQSSKKMKPGDKKPPEGKSVQPKVAQSAADGKSKQENKVPAADVNNNLKPTADSKSKQENKFPAADVNNNLKPTADSKSKQENKVPAADVNNNLKPTADSKSKQENKVPAADVNNLKTSVTSGTPENQENGKISGKMTDDGTFKVPDNKKQCVYMNEKEKSKSESLVSRGDKQVKEEQSGEKKNKVPMNKPLKPSALSTDKDKKNMYREFVVTRRPTDEKNTWFRVPWEDKLKQAYNQGTAILLHNLKPDYTSDDVEDIIWHAFNESYCDAKILPRIAVSSPHYNQALILLKTKEAAQRILTELDEGCLMLSDERPLVATPCPPISTKKDFTFFGHLAVDKARFQNQREDDAVSTSHFSQPNTIEYDMAMEWFFLQLKSEKWWTKLHKKQGIELRSLKKDLILKKDVKQKQKPA